MQEKNPVNNSKRRDFTNEIIGYRRKFEAVPETSTTSVSKKRNKKPLIFGLSAILALLVISSSFLLLKKEPAPVPKNVQNGTNFSIYTPDPKKIPTGYSLDQSSFTKPQSDVVVYNLLNQKGQKISVSVQSKPEKTVIDNFYKSVIPLRYEVPTSIGTAQIGAYHTNDGTQTIASLPTNDNIWILITAPEDIKQAVIEKVLTSLKK